MAYLPSNAPIGPNSLQAPSASCVAASNQRIAEAEMQAARGRLGTFLTVPPLSSFDSPTLAGDAARILAQSEVGRASILSNGTPQRGTQGGGGSISYRDMMDEAPEVVPLNGRSAEQVCGAVLRVQDRPAAPVMRMPQPAPDAIQIRGVQVFVEAAPINTTWMQAGGGLTGYAPPWGDANLIDVAGPQNGAGWLLGLLGLGGLVILGSVAAGTKARRKRRYKR